MVRETGNGKTPERVICELNKKLENTSLNAISKATGVGISALHRYQRGIGEPTTATLEKLADYFGKSVAWLRGEIDTTSYAFSLMDTWMLATLGGAPAEAVVKKARSIKKALIDKEGLTDKDASELLQEMIKHIQYEIEHPEEPDKDDILDLTEDELERERKRIIEKLKRKESADIL